MIGHTKLTIVINKYTNITVIIVILVIILIIINIPWWGLAYGVVSKGVVSTNM